MANLSITAANVLASATAKRGEGTAGDTITAGMPLYVDAADSNTLKPGQATSTKYKIVGIALHGAADGQPIEYAIEDDDFTPGATVAVGVVYGASATAGAVAPVSDWTTGDYGSAFMIGKSTSKVKLLCHAGLRADAAKA